MERAVVVSFEVKVLVNNQTGVYAARILELGVTAYGETAYEAVQKVKLMYASAVRVHRGLGTLEDWLDRSGLKWGWDDEYDGTFGPVETDNYVGTAALNWDDLAVEQCAVAA